MFKSGKVIKFIKRASTAEPLRKTGSRMKAWQIHSYGDLSELQLTHARIPVIKNPKDVLVKVEAASVNPIDKMLISGYGRELLGFLRNYELEFPLTLGRDFSGTIIDKGQNVDFELNVGDEVFGILPPHKQGSHAEAVLCPSETVCYKPKNISHLEAASLAYGGVTAWSALYLSGELLIRSSKNCNILILGASGGVGTVATQILKSQSARVFGTCSENAMPLVRSLGADKVFDYRDKDYSQNVSDAGIYDIILDCAKFGHENIPKTWKYKRFVTLNAPLLENADKYGFLGGVIASARDVVCSNFPKIMEGKTVRWGFVMPSNNGLRFIASLIEKEQLRPVIQQVFKFDEMPKAYEMLSAGHLRGKIMIDFSAL